jgi:poly(3-hydroxyalkanoate) synthetase
VRCPVLLLICDSDSTTPASAAAEAERTLGSHAEVKHYPIGHFDIYRGEHLKRSLRDQLAFLRKHLQS